MFAPFPYARFIRLLCFGTRAGHPSPYSACVCKACFHHSAFWLIRRRSPRLFVALAMDWFKCDWDEEQEARRLTKWTWSAGMAKSRFIPHSFRQTAI
jgi:hypothetical protein